MRRQLLGVETEYAFTASARNGRRMSSEAVMPRLCSAAQDAVRHLRDGSDSGLFLENGGRFYVDAGFHPEMSTPECEDPWDVVRFVRAGDALMLRFARAVVSRSRGRVGAVCVSRHNVDYSRKACSWGSHESYMTQRDPTELADQILSHLVSRIIYTGAGGFFSSVAGMRFVLSPRVRFLQQVVSSDSMSRRGIFHTKDEPLCRGGFHRLHLLCGESLSSDLALWLRIATTAIVTRLAQIGSSPGRELALLHPVESMRALARDVACKSRLIRRVGPAMTAVEIQRAYLEAAEMRFTRGDLPPWAGDVCRAWRELLDDLEQDPERLASKLDWPAKLVLFRRHAERRGIPWDELQSRSKIAQVSESNPRPISLSSHTGSSPSGESAPAGPPETDLGAGGGPADPMAVETQCRMSAEERAGSEAARAERATLLQFLELDTRCGELGPQGIFEQLSRRGVLRHRLVEPADVERATTEPPPSGRAKRRGEMVREFAGRDDIRCSWARVGLGREQVLADLSDPFAETAPPAVRVPGGKEASGAA